MLIDLFKMNILRSPDGGAGAGGEETPNTESSQEETPKGAGQPEIKIGDETFDRNDPELIEKLTTKGNNLQSGLTKKSQELSKLKKTQPKVEVKKETEIPKETKKPDLATERINRMYERTINTDVDTFIKSEIDRYSAKFGENFDKIKDDFTKEANEIKGFKLDVKEQILGRKNLDVIVNNVLAKSMMIAKTKETPNPKKDINSFKEAEKIPPTPQGQGQANISGEISMEQQLKGDTRFTKAKELAKRSRAIRSGEGVRD